MKNLLSSLESISTKTAYQSYVVNIGFEKIDVLVPLKNAQAFESQMNSVKPESVRFLIEAVEALGGKKA